MAQQKRSDEARVVVPPGAVTEPLAHTLDFGSFTARLLALITYDLVWLESQELRRRFGLGTNEWRTLASLAVQPGMTSGGVAQSLELNKAIISKSSRLLVDRGLIVLGDGPRGSRPMFLTEAGVEMHDKMLPISEKGQDIILEGISQDDARRLNTLLHGMLDRIRAARRGESDGAAGEDE